VKDRVAKSNILTAFEPTSTEGDSLFLTRSVVRHG